MWLARLENRHSGARQRLTSLMNSKRLELLGIQLGARTHVLGRPIVQVHTGSRVSVGADCLLISRAEWTALGVSRPIVIRTLTAGASITIGDRCGLSGATICAASAVTIGDRVLLGADVLITDTDFHPVDATPRTNSPLPDSTPADHVHIADDAFIGARSLILRGVSIGEGSVIGAGSVVTRDIPPWVVAAGVPARVIRPIRRAKTAAAPPS
jgi:acetyltransferase-like isoleucine patch superfamily enzyme